MVSFRVLFFERKQVFPPTVFKLIQTVELKLDSKAILPPNPFGRTTYSEDAFVSSM
jgi:hypothetical protein